MTDSSFLKLVTGTRIKNYMGLVLEEGVTAAKGKNYLYLELPAVRFLGSEADKESDTLIKRNQHVFLLCGATINVKGPNMALVEPSVDLCEYGQVQASFHVHPDSGEKAVGFWFTARKDTDLSKLAYGVRLYLVA